MKINKEIIENKLIIKLSGRLDTNSAPELEDEINNVEGINNVLFDLEELEYISSSGLRIILKCKKNIDSTKVINCSPEIYDIFYITGFVDLMEIEKKNG